MLKKKIWLPILSVLLIAIGYGLWHSQQGSKIAQDIERSLPPNLPRIPPDPSPVEKIIEIDTKHAALREELERVIAMPRGTEAERQAYLDARAAHLNKKAALRAELSEIHRKQQDFIMIMDQRHEMIKRHRAALRAAAEKGETR